jgi:hypothetical protein
LARSTLLVARKGLSMNRPLICIALICLALAFSLSAQTFDYNTSNWSTYEFPKEGFAIKYPPNWIVMRQEGFVAVRPAEMQAGIYDQGELTGAVIVILPLEKFDVDDAEISRFEIERIDGLKIRTKNSSEKFIELDAGKRYVKLWLIPFTKTIIPQTYGQDVNTFVRQWSNPARKDTPFSKIFEKVYERMFETFERTK